MPEVQVRQMVGIYSTCVQSFPAQIFTSYEFDLKVKDGSTSPHNMSVEHRHLLDISHGLTAATSAKGHSFAVIIRTGSCAGPAHLCKGQSDRSWDTLRWLQAVMSEGRQVGGLTFWVLKNLLPVTPFSRMRRLKPRTSDIAATSQSPQPLFFLRSQNLGREVPGFLLSSLLLKPGLASRQFKTPFC